MTRITRRDALGLAAGGAAIGALGAPAIVRAQAPLRIIISNDTQAATLKGKTWETFKREIESEMGSRVNVQLHHSGTLYDQRGQVQALQLGAIQFISSTVGVLAATAPRLSALLLPYLLPTPKAIEAAILDPQVGEQLLGDLRAKAIEPAAIWLNGPRDVGRRGSPILRPGDMRGLKVRVPPGNAYLEAFRQLGANVVAINWGEVPTALAQGVIDVVEPVPNAWLASRLYEQANHITRTGYVLDFYVVASNKTWWDRMPPQHKEAVRRNLDKATRWNWENTEKENEDAYATMASRGATIHTLTPAQLAEWREAMQPVWARVGNPLVGEAMMRRLADIGRANS